MSNEEQHLLGRGGGHGTYDGLTLSEIADRFKQCIQDPGMRSVSAVLRITREQVMARGNLSHYPRIALAFLCLAGVCFLVMPVLPPDLKSAAPKAAVGLVAMSAILGYGSITSSRDRKAAQVQEREIYRMAVDALEQILVHPFARKTLTREQVDTLRTLLKQSPSSAPVRELLESSLE